MFCYISSKHHTEQLVSLSYTSVSWLYLFVASEELLEFFASSKDGHVRLMKIGIANGL